MEEKRLLEDRKIDLEGRKKKKRKLEKEGTSGLSYKLRSKVENTVRKGISGRERKIS